MTRLSVVMAVFNEEENIGRCLDAVRDLADEIIIVDGNSNDRTVEIAKKYSAEVHITANLPNFHINKQKAIDLATCDWILQLDADEIVSPELKEEIRNILKEDATNKNPNFEARNSKQIINSNDQNSKQIGNLKFEIGNSHVEGYWIPRKNWFLGRFLMKGGQYPDYTIRLYKRGKGRLPQKDVHEQAVVDGEVGYLKHALLHYPYKDFTAYLIKWHRYTSLLASQMRDNKENRKIIIRIYNIVNYLILKPVYWFCVTYIRHKGFMDLWPGFVFSLFSSLRFPVAYVKYLKKR